MAPVFGFFSFLHGKENKPEENDSSEETDDVSVQDITMWYLLFLLGTFLIWLLAYFILRLINISMYFKYISYYIGSFRYKALSL